MVVTNGQDQWSKEDIVTLLEHMDNNLPSNDNHTFKTTQSHMDWEKVAFKDYSGDMCKRKWLEVSYNLRKIRTLKELVLEAKEHVNKSYKHKKCKTHPDLPKKPLTSYLRFFKEERPHYSQKHPGLNNQELTKVLSKTYKELPEHRKMKYIQDYQKEKQEFKEKLAQFRKDHPELVQNSKKSVISKRSLTTAQKQFQGKAKDVKPPPSNCFPEEMRFRGEPKKPPMNEYHKFHQDLWWSEDLQDLPHRERMVEISRRWQRVPQSQRERYRRQAEDMQEQYRGDLEHWLRSLSSEEYAAYRQRTCAKRKNMNPKGGPAPKWSRTDFGSPSARSRPEGLGQEQGLQTPESSETTGSHSSALWGSEDKEGEDKVEGGHSSEEDEKCESG